MQHIQHLGGCEACDGMNPIGSQLHHGAKEKIALGQMGMRHLQCGSINHPFIDGYNVNIDQAVNVIAVTVAVGGTSQPALDIVDAVQHHVWIDVAIEPQPYVHKAAVAFKSPGFTLDDMGHHRPASARRQSNDGAIKIIAPVAHIATYIQVIIHVYKVL